MIKFYNKIEFKACLLYTLQLCGMLIVPLTSCTLGVCAVSASSLAPERPSLFPCPGCVTSHSSIFKFDLSIISVHEYYYLGDAVILGSVWCNCWLDLKRILTCCTKAARYYFLNKNVNNFLKVVNSIFLVFVFLAASKGI